MIDVKILVGNIGVKFPTKETEVLGDKTVQMPLAATQIPHGPA
jgi:hypothetical protein